MNEFFEEIKFITEFCGFDIFKSNIENNTKYELFYIKGRKSDAQGFYNENGFTVLKGSIIASTVTRSFLGEGKRDELIEVSTENIEGNIVLRVNHTFNSPSTAASFCTGHSANGWTTWKNKKNKTLDDIYRK